MGDKKGFFELLLDFSFQQILTARYVRFLYALHLLLGLVVAIWTVFNGFQVSQSQGLITLILAVVGYFFWILYVRIALEFLTAVFRIAEAASPTPSVREEH